MRNKDLTIVKNYYKLKDDTLFIRTPTADDVSISEAKNPIITISKDSIEIKKGKSIKDAFKIRESFKIIVLKDGDTNLILENCVN
jgi:hypothetical protein